MNSSVRRILVVDDDEDACHNLSDILSDLDYVVDVALCGEDAIRLVEQSAYDVALLDLKMPGMDGISLYRHLKKRRPETVAVLITAYASREAETEATRETDLQVLAKPVNLGRLLPFIEESLQQPLVLIVDDDRDLCLSLWDIFRERGFRVSLAHSGDEAARRVLDRSFRVILVDLRLPDSTGLAVAEAIRTTAPTARILLMTGHREQMEDLVCHSPTSHVDAVCYKPLDVSRLLSMVEEFTLLPEQPLSPD